MKKIAFWLYIWSKVTLTFKKLKQKHIKKHRNIEVSISQKEVVIVKFNLSVGNLTSKMILAEDIISILKDKAEDLDQIIKNTNNFKMHRK